MRNFKRRSSHDRDLETPHSSPSEDSRECTHCRARFKKCEERLVEILIEVESSGLHLKFGCSSLFQYATDHIKLSEAVSLNAIAVARKAREVPELRAEIQAIGISKARKMLSVLTRENQKEWIERAKTVSSRALEKVVAKENPRAATPEKATYVSEKRLDLRLGVSEELMLKIRRAQDQASRSTGKSASLEDTFEVIVSFYLRHKDPLEKAKRVIAKKGAARAAAPADTDSAASQTTSLNKLFTGTVPAEKAAEAKAPQRPPLRAPIPAAIAHQIRVRDQNQCQAIKPAGGICGEHRWTDLHHVTPVSRGGTNDPQNLLTLCRAHHLAHHRQV